MGTHAPKRSMRFARLATTLAAALTAIPGIATGQERPLAWDAAENYQYNILGMLWDSGQRRVTVVFNVTNPRASQAPYDVLAAPELKPTAPESATLRIDVGWNTAGWGTAELVNTGFTAAGGGGEALIPIIRTWMNASPPNPGGVGTASPNVINALTAGRPCTTAGSPCAGFANASRTYFASTVLPAQAVGMARVAMEGHPVLRIGTDPAGQPLFANVPVKGAFRDLALDASAVPRRTIVEFGKCAACHDNRRHGDVVVPRLSLHGANRNEEPGLCVVCHNPNQTDAAYRSSGAEESIDFKRMVHGIHAGGMRKNPLIIIGFRGSVNDYSHVRFPAKLRNCVTCHIDSGGRGTFELPLASVLGSTIGSGSVLSPLPGTVEVNPANDLKISPIAATCSGCHDDRETRRHMTQMGASFGVQQVVLAGKELCVNCHGRGRSKDVRKVHEIRSSGSGDDD